MSSIASQVRLCSSRFLRDLRFHARPNNSLLSPRPPSLLVCFPITFQRLSNPKTSLFQAINSQQQEEVSLQAPAALDLTVLPRGLRDIVSLFQSVSDPKARYQQLLHYGGRLPPLDPRYKTDEHRVRGCVSRVWVRAFPDPEDADAVRFEADSDSALTKGLAALLVLGLSGVSAVTIARITPDFVHLLGLRQSLTPSRNNGFLNMFKMMQHEALQLSTVQSGDSVGDGVSEEKSSVSDGTGVNESGNNSGSTEVLDSKDVNLAVDGNGVGTDPVINVFDDTFSSNSGDLLSGGRASRIRGRLERELRPVELEVEDISYQHAGHAAVRGNSDGETHFNVRIVSKEFEGKSLIKRHRLVYDLLQGELQTGLHALSIVAKTPSEVGRK